MNNIRGPIQSVTSDAESAPKKQRKVLTLQEKVELLNMYHRLGSAAAIAQHFKINESRIRTTVKKKNEICEAITAAMPAGGKTLQFLRNTFLSCIDNVAFLWGQDCSKKGMPIHSNMIQEKAKSLYNNLKQKEGEGSKAGNLMPAKDGLINLERGLA